MKRHRLLSALALLTGWALAGPAQAQVKEGRRLEACREVLEELLSGKESIPRELLDKAECVAVIPSAKKFALGFGGRYGRGAVACRVVRHPDQIRSIRVHNKQVPIPGRISC